MRDISLVMFLAAMLPLIPKFPMIGIGLWVWVSIMNPHRMVYGFAYGQPLNQLIAILTLASIALNAGTFKLRSSPYLTMLLIFVAWCTLTTFTVSVSPQASAIWDRFWKSGLLAVLIMATARTPARIHAIVWVVAISLGFHSAFGGMRTIVTAGGATISGPPGTQFSDNNDFAVSILLVVPLLVYLMRNSVPILIKIGLFLQILLSSACVIGTYSRGGTISLGIAMAGLWLRSKHKVKIGLAVLMLSGTVIGLLPERYLGRISTISNASEDNSFQGRVDAWFVALNVANNYPLGVGFAGSYEPQIWDQYLPEESRHAAHSIYFQVLGDHGWVGLAIFLIMLATVWRTNTLLLRGTRDRPDLKWANDLAQMIQISLVTYLVGGAALSIAYLDVLMVLASVSTATLQYVDAQRDSQRADKMRRPMNIRPVAAGALKASE